MASIIHFNGTGGHQIFNPPLTTSSSTSYPFSLSSFTTPSAINRVHGKLVTATDNERAIEDHGFEQSPYEPPGWASLSQSPDIFW